MLSVRNNFVSLVEYFGKENSDEEDESNDIYTMRDLFKDKIDAFINFSCDIRSDISKDPSIKVEVSYKTKNASYDIDPSKFQAFKKCFFKMKYILLEERIINLQKMISLKIASDSMLLL